MPAAVQHLPVLQSWSCHGCTNCCREYEIAISEEEHRRLLNQDWEKDAAVGPRPFVVRQGPWWARRYRLNHRPDGTCVFLTPQGRCRIHERFGGNAKPLTCRLFPFILVPAYDHWRVALRYACPSAAANKGRPLTEYQRELSAYASELQEHFGLDLSRFDPPPLQRTQRVQWPDLFRFVQALLGLVRNRQDRIERRLRKCLALAQVCRQARFDEVKGSRLVEFLKLISDSLEAEVVRDPAQVPPPSWIGRMLFRQALVIYVRKDHGPNRRLVSGRSALLRAAWRFAVGKGMVPRLHGWLPQDLTFERVEEPAGPLTPDDEQALERYYAVKIESLQFCGSTNFGMPFWQGLEALILTLPVILWFQRALAGTFQREAAIKAVEIVDNNFGFNRLLGTMRQRYSLSTLARRGELERLVAWYSR
jgi:lysine-N-methylase